MRILAVESSCDDTAAAVLDGATMGSNVVASQDDVHYRYGGVVPELASRSHLRSITRVIERALHEAGVDLADIHGIAATCGPGLVGSLLVGLSAAKAIAAARGLPFLGINHLEGHLLSVLLDHPVEFPYLGLIVSGGHTGAYLAEAVGRYRLLGATRDDAAGEAFDKAAKMLGLGYPGGRVIDRLATTGNPRAFPFPRARLKRTRAGREFDFSFSGIKTALWHFVNDGKVTAVGLENVAASFQEAVVDMLLETALAAAERYPCTRLVITGGVAANSRLRARAREAGSAAGLEVHVPAPQFCTDNAAMIGLAAHYRFARGESSPLTLNAAADLEL